VSISFVFDRRDLPLMLSLFPQGQLVTKDYPPHALAVIGLLVASSTMCIPLVALGTFIRNRLKRGGSAPVA
jgi:solute carrier family 6 amino acid/orphan transporter-like 15/16/17/18/20